MIIYYIFKRVHSHTDAVEIDVPQVHLYTEQTRMRKRYRYRMDS